MESIAGWVAAWLAMGGYAVFVWLAYGVTAAVLGGLAWQSWRRHRVSEKEAARLQRPDHPQRRVGRSA